MLFCLRLRSVPLDDGAKLLLHDGLRALVGPLGGEDVDLAGLLHVLLVHGSVSSFAENVAWQWLGTRWRRCSGRHALHTGRRPSWTHRPCAWRQIAHVIGPTEAHSKVWVYKKKSLV